MSIPRAIYGFTLIELLVVLAILALSIAIVPPMFDNVMGDIKLRNATRELAAGLRSTRDHAVLTGQEQTLRLDTHSTTFYVGVQQKQLNLPANTPLVLTTAKVEQLSDFEGMIRFYPDGSSTGGRVVLGRDPNFYQIDINWLTGQVAILP